ncbi:MAG: hypothetical protein O9353_01280 [Bacteroidia bacterium]|nr:hypothetical protein [Bacteroidia bacterium]
MPIFNLFSKRQKILRGEVPDIYTYDNIPQALRVQIVHIIRDALRPRQRGSHFDESYDPYKTIHDIIAREYGLFSLGDPYDGTEEERLFGFFIDSKDTEQVIDIIEISFTLISAKKAEWVRYETGAIIKPDYAIEELNGRFKEHAIGYAFEGDEIVKIDSTYTHSEIVKPTLNLLSKSQFIGANEEYLKAHEHYRHGRNKECLTECLKAFESTMKIICNEKGWAYDQNDTARKLIQICFQNNIVPTFSQNQFTSLQNLLESGIPTIRNKLGGHGQGAIPQKVDDEMTRYALNLTGTNIIFLIEQSGL